DENDPLVLQFTEAQASVLEPSLGRSVYNECGRRVVEGQALIQASHDIFLGWDRITSPDDGATRDFYVRQLWDWKVSADVETMTPADLVVYSQMCGRTLAHAHAR